MTRTSLNCTKQAIVSLQHPFLLNGQLYWLVWTSRIKSPINSLIFKKEKSKEITCYTQVNNLHNMVLYMCLCNHCMGYCIIVKREEEEELEKASQLVHCIMLPRFAIVAIEGKEGKIILKACSSHKSSLCLQISFSGTATMICQVTAYSTFLFTFISKRIDRELYPLCSLCFKPFYLLFFPFRWMQ